MYRHIGHSLRILYENDRGEVIMFSQCVTTPQIHVFGYGFERLCEFDDDDVPSILSNIEIADRVSLSYDGASHTMSIIGWFGCRELMPVSIGHYTIDFEYSIPNDSPKYEHIVDGECLYKVPTQVGDLFALCGTSWYVKQYMRRTTHTLWVLGWYVPRELAHHIAITCVELYLYCDYVNYSDEVADSYEFTDETDDDDS